MAKNDKSASGGSPSSGGNSRLLSIVASAALVAGTIACCVCGGAVYQQWPTFRTDREEAVSVTRDIVPLTVPAVFTPEGTIEWDIWMFVRMRGAYYSLSTGDGELSLLEVDSRFIDNGEFRAHIIRSMREHGAGGGFDLAVRNAETKEYEIAGRTVEFQFLEAEDRTTGSDRRLVDGIVEGHHGPVMISLWVDEESWDPQMVDAMISSIGEPQGTSD